jgi:hypothetical protein
MGRPFAYPDMQGRRRALIGKIPFDPAFCRNPIWCGGRRAQRRR